MVGLWGRAGVCKNVRFACLAMCAASWVSIFQNGIRAVIRTHDLGGEHSGSCPVTQNRNGFRDSGSTATRMMVNRKKRVKITRLGALSGREQDFGGDGLMWLDETDRCRACSWHKESVLRVIWRRALG